MYHGAPMLRVGVIVAAVLAIFLACNIITVRHLLRIHPRRKGMVIALAVIGNVMWLFFPLLNARTNFSRAVRAVFGPPWFAWLCFVLVYSIMLLMIAVVWLLFRRVPFAHFARWPSRLFLWTTMIAGAIGFYTALVPLDIIRVPVILGDLPPELDRTRIAIIADLHIGLFTRPSRLQEIFAATNALSPDIVLLNGDLVDDDPYYAPKLLAGTGALAPSIPLIAVLGNHEMYGEPFKVIERLRGTRIRLLVNEGLALRGIWIAGLSDYAARTEALKPNLAAALANRPAAMFPIVVAHQPRAFVDARKFEMPLTLCAHSHGGQCGFRPLRWSLAGLFLPYHMGLYERAGAQLYVNTGTGYWLLPWRLGLTPEITLIELRRRRR
jgi:predicted MPP superfamily phosphohydrolase